MSKVNKDIVSFLLKAGIDSGNNKIQEEKAIVEDTNIKTSRVSDLSEPNAQNPNRSPQKQKTQPIRTEQKIERNAPCPCGSGKKYKKCHGK